MSILMGLGQGLQQAAGTVGDMYRQKESNRRYGLEQDLAERERRDRANAAGVASMDRQAAMMQDQKQFEIKNAADQSFRNNSYGMDMMKLDHDAMNAERQYELEKDRNASYRIMANNQGLTRGGNSQDRYYDEQRIIATVGQLNNELKAIQGDLNPLFDMVNPNDPEIAAKKERAAKLQQMIDVYQQKLGTNLLGADSPEMKALQGVLSAPSGVGSPNASVMPPRDRSRPF